MSSDPYLPFRELMIPMSGVTKMSLLQRGDKKIFLIGEYHTQEFCKTKGLTPLCSIIDEYLRTRTEPVDFMMETKNEVNYEIPPLDQTRAIVANVVNIPYPSQTIPRYTMELVRNMVVQYIVPMRNPVFPTQRTATTLENARVHWLDPEFHHPTTKGDMLIYFMSKYMNLYNTIKSLEPTFNMNHLTSLYLLRSQINHILDIDTPEIPWAMHDKRVVSLYRDSPSTFQTHVFDTIPDKELFVQTKDLSKWFFLRKVYEALDTSKFFRKCFIRDNERFISWSRIRDVFIQRWNHEKEDNSIENFYFVIQRFFMDFFACCRLLKDEGRWYKNIVIYAGVAHTENIENLLRLLKFTNVPLPDIRYNPGCSSGGSKKKKNKNKRKTRR